MPIAQLRRRSPLARTFFTPADLSAAALVRAFISAAGEFTAARRDPLTRAAFQRRNSRSLTRKVKILTSLFESVRDSPAAMVAVPSSAVTCFKEFYILIHRCRILLDYCCQSGRLWLLLQNLQVSGYFHDLEQEIATLVDVLPLTELRIADDVREQVELLRRQSRRSVLFVDPDDEQLRLRIFSFLEDFEKGRVPDPADLRSVFVDRLGIRDAGACRTEIDSLEEQIYGQDEDAHPSILGSVVALTRYCRFMLFGMEERSELVLIHSKKRFLLRGGIRDPSIAIPIPKDLCCPVTLDLMSDPVIVSTGQTYDRESIAHWIDEGHDTCPNSGQLLSHTRLVPNLALRSLISQWCAAHGVPFDPPDAFSEALAESTTTAYANRAAVEANRLTAKILVQKLSDGSESIKTIAAHELRILAKTGKENRACIAEAGAIPLLQSLLSSSNPAAQENSVTAILNLSIHDKNKSRIIENDGCLASIVDVLVRGLTTEARENAAATLFSLSAIHEFKKMIADEAGAMEALARLLKDGSPRGMKDAVTALFNISTHSGCCERMVESGATSALVAALEIEGVAEDAAGALALLLRHPIVSEAIFRENSVVGGLVGLMRRGGPKGKENAVAALHEMCRSGCVGLMQRVVRAPMLGGMVQSLMFTGTKRARRKAASLMRMWQRFDSAAESPFGGGWGIEYALARNASMRRRSNFVGGGDVSVSVSVAISVPVL